MDLRSLRPARILGLLAAIAAVLVIPAARAAVNESVRPSQAVYELCSSGPCWISLGKRGSGTGTVTSEPAGMECGTTCLAPYTHGSSATLVATPHDGSRFTRWEGVGCDRQTSPRCTLFMDEGRSITAVFDLIGAPDTPPPGATPQQPPSAPPPVSPPPSLPSGTGCTITGTNGNDELTGTRGRDVICALGGADHIHPRGGNDIVRAGAGSDEVEAGPGADTIDGGAGADALFGDGGNDRLKGGSGRDAVSGGAGSDLLFLRDAVRDMGRGGPGRDRTRSDRIDRLVAVERRF